MIGRYLMLLTQEQRDLTLTTKMRPGAYGFGNMSMGPCLVGACEYGRSYDVFVARRLDRLFGTFSGRSHTLETRYDALCARYTTEWVNQRIRDKVLFGRGPSMSVPTQECRHAAPA